MSATTAQSPRNRSCRFIISILDFTPDFRVTVRGESSSNPDSFRSLIFFFFLLLVTIEIWFLDNSNSIFFFFFFFLISRERSFFARFEFLRSGQSNKWSLQYYWNRNCTSVIIANLCNFVEILNIACKKHELGSNYSRAMFFLFTKIGLIVWRGHLVTLNAGLYDNKIENNIS